MGEEKGADFTSSRFFFSQKKIRRRHLAISHDSGEKKGEAVVCGFSGEKESGYTPSSFTLESRHSKSCFLLSFAFLKKNFPEMF